LKNERGVAFSWAPGVRGARSRSDGPAKSKLEDYLKQFQYEAIPFKLNEGNKPDYQGEL